MTRLGHIEEAEAAERLAVGAIDYETVRRLLDSGTGATPVGGTAGELPSAIPAPAGSTDVPDHTLAIALVGVVLAALLVYLPLAAIAYRAWRAV